MVEIKQIPPKEAHSNGGMLPGQESGIGHLLDQPNAREGEVFENRVLVFTEELSELEKVVHVAGLETNDGDIPPHVGVRKRLGGRTAPGRAFHLYRQDYVVQGGFVEELPSLVLFLGSSGQDELHRAA